MQYILLSSQPHPQNVHCEESLVWFKAFTDTLLEYTAVDLSHGDPVVISRQVQSLYTLQQVMDGVDVRVGQPKVHDVGLSGS